MAAQATKAEEFWARKKAVQERFERMSPEEQEQEVVKWVARAPRKLSDWHFTQAWVNAIERAASKGLIEQRWHAHSKGTDRR